MWEFVWYVPLSSKAMTGYGETGGGGRIIGEGGSKTVFEEGVYGMFSPPLSFSPRFSHKTSENPLDGRAFPEHPAGVSEVMPFSVSFFFSEQKEMRGTPAGRPLFVPPGVPRGFCKALFLV